MGAGPILTGTRTVTTGTCIHNNTHCIATSGTISHPSWSRSRPVPVAASQSLTQYYACGPPTVATRHHTHKQVLTSSPTAVESAGSALMAAVRGAARASARAPCFTGLSDYAFEASEETARSGCVLRCINVFLKKHRLGLLTPGTRPLCLVSMAHTPVVHGLQRVLRGFHALTLPLRGAELLCP